MDEQMQQQIVALVQAALQGDQQAQQQIQQVMEAAQAGDEQAIQIAQLIQQVAQELQGGQQQEEAPISAKLGAKLNYIKYLRGQCPDGYEMQMFKKGGTVCKKCVKKGAQGISTPTRQYNDAVEEFKCGRKMKKKACGGTMQKKK